MSRPLAVFALALPILAAAQAKDTLYHSQYAVWVTEHANFAQCQKYKANIDSIEKELDLAFPIIDEYLGLKPEKMPLTVNVDPETEGMGGWAGGGEVGYQISDFFGAPQNADGLRWIRGVVIGEVINASTGAVTGDWPLDWWVDHVWYFPGFIAGEVLKRTVTPKFSDYWITSEDYPTYPVYNVFQDLLKEFGWAYYKDMFALVKADKMDWGEVGPNPSAIKTNYVAAYMGLAAGRNLAGTLRGASVDDADATVVAEIMKAEQRLREGDKRKLNTADAWRSFRSGDYAAANSALDKLGITAVRPKAGYGNVAVTSGYRPMAYSLTGRRIVAGNGSEVASPGAFVLRR